ncbi:MAG: cytochrome c-type biogenesis protein CcmH [Anaerolineales bacterium]|nr:cytochrome c-type biogenesis protein CcmH [Anaerolineales bacterium]
MRRILLGSLSLLLMLVLSTYSSAIAQEGGEGFPTDNDVNAIAKQLYCPVCPNTPLDVCETKACQDWRAQIRDQLEEGWTEDEIIDYFVVEYGERVLAEPRRAGFTSLVWILPLIAAAVGAGAAWQVLRLWRRRNDREGASPPDQIPVDAKALERIERELDEIR